jgi:hypothetical protein
MSSVSRLASLDGQVQPGPERVLSVVCWLLQQATAFGAQCAGNRGEIEEALTRMKEEREEKWGVSRQAKPEAAWFQVWANR